MNNSLYILKRYWKKHKKNAVAMLFAGVLLTAVVFVTMMSYREKVVRIAHKIFDSAGHYDLMIVNSDDEIVSKILNGEKGYKDDYNYGVVYVYGKLGTEDKQFTYGSAVDDKHNLLHVPLVEGRMPKTDTELAISAKVLEAFFWPGKCGDTITLEGNTYTVVGIIDGESFGRHGVDEELYKWYDPEYQAYVTPYRIPSIFIGKTDKEPQYRIDMFNNFWAYPHNTEFGTDYTNYQYHINGLVEESGDKWCDTGSEEGIYVSYRSRGNDTFFLIIAWIGAVIAVLSVYSILKNVFADRRGRIETLKKIGMSQRSVGCMYAVECAAFTLIQTVVGFAVGLGVYGGILWFKTSFLGEKPYSGFTNIRKVIALTSDPFLTASVISVAVMAVAYVINILTSRVGEKTPKKTAKPRSLFRSIGRVFRQSGVSVVQTAALTLICFSAVMGYMYHTDNGKKINDGIYITYAPNYNYYYANNFDMEEDNIAEYYSSVKPDVVTVGSGEGNTYSMFPLVSADFTAGIDDATAEQLPANALITGNLTQTFIAVDKPKGNVVEIDLKDESILQSVIASGDEEYKDIFDEFASKNLYSIETRLTTADNIESLSEYVVDGEINLDALNRGEEVLVMYEGPKEFKAGETFTLYSVANNETGWGIGGKSSAEVKVGAIVRVNDKIGKVEYYTVRGENNYNLLTTATGANAMGLHAAKYTEIYTSEPMDGGLIPSSAEMTLISLAQLKRKTLIDTLVTISGMAFILVLMVLMGFAAYFNGIGMKIRSKAYEFSVLRAVGTPVSSLRNRLLISSIKIPVIASAVSYVMVKLVQSVMGYVNQYMVDFVAYKIETGGYISGGKIDWENRLVNFLEDKVFLTKGMWMVNAVIPTLILLAAMCAVTFILTAIALKRFKGNIAGDLSEGRKRR